MDRRSRGVLVGDVLENPKRMKSTCVLERVPWFAGVDSESYPFGIGSAIQSHGSIVHVGRMEIPRDSACILIAP